MQTNNQNVESVEENYSFVIGQTDLDQFKRLDQYLAAQISGYSRSFIKRLFELGQISCENENIQLSLKKMPPLKTCVEVNIPPAPPSDAIPENIPLEILYEDKHLLFVNKPAGMVTHPAPGHSRGTLVNAVLHHCPDIQGIGGVKRPGIVHRLDKGTSGVMVVAKNQICHEALILLFQAHDIKRQYQALTVQAPHRSSGTIESTIGRSSSNRLKMAANVKRGKRAVTHYKVIESQPNLTHFQLTLETGRTHQIRVHLSQILQTPILMDPLYAHPARQIKKVSTLLQPLLVDYPHPLLHAKKLGLRHPITGKELVFEVPPPEPFSKVLQVSFHD